MITIEQRELLIELLTHTMVVGVQDAKDGLFGRVEDLEPEDFRAVEDKLQAIIDLIEI